VGLGSSGCVHDSVAHTRTRENGLAWSGEEEEAEEGLECPEESMTTRRLENAMGGLDLPYPMPIQSASQENANSYVSTMSSNFFLGHCSTHKQLNFDAQVLKCFPTQGRVRHCV
jgi:hypothetical protein